MPPSRQIVLASASPYRRTLLERLGIPFDTAAPDIDERRLAGETASDMVKRLSLAKARALAGQFPAALIIGSDQCAVIDGEILGKPGNYDNAYTQLKNAAGHQVDFHTGLCLLDATSGESQVDDIIFSVTFRQLTDSEIQNYLQREQPYDCAGSFKSEGLGIALFERLQGDDPNALIGLPIIRLLAFLRNAGVNILV